MSDPIPGHPSDEEFVLRAIKNVRPHRVCARWVALTYAFACGSTVAQELCRRFGLDPDETVKPGRSGR